MKKILKSSVLTLLIAAVLLFATACGITVTFDPCGGEIKSGKASVKYDEKTEVKAPEVVREGYEFSGWDKDFSNPAEDITVGALWEKLYTVTFDTQGGEITDGVSAVQKVTQNGKIAYPAVSREGYKLGKWSADAESVTEDTVIKAEWEKLYTVTFDIQGGEITDGANAVQKVTQNEKITYPAVSREGYKLGKWSTDAENVTEDTVIKAEWKKLYTVTFDVNGGDIADGSALVQLVAEGEAATAPEVSLEYRVLKGWDKSFDNVTEDITVKAVWEHKTLTNSEMFNYINPATVEISTYRFGEAEAIGSGFFISTDGRVVTNFHVLEYALEIKVKTGDGKEGNVTKIIAWDEDKDILLLQTDLTDTPMLDIRQDEVKTGEVVFALGSSLGLSGTFTTGIVSTASREIEGATYIQTTAQISSGNSGGPLVDEKGYVIGINTLSATTGQNLNFSIPISRVSELEETPRSVEEWAELLRYNEYKMWENYVKEINDRPATTYQGIKNGDTVEATTTPSEDLDYFYLEKSEVERLSEEGKVYDLYFLFATDDYDTLKMAVQHLCLVYYNTLTKMATEMDTLYDYAVAEEDGT